MTIAQWSTTASLNVLSSGTTGTGGTNIGEGCAPSGVNNAMRDIMAQVATWRTSATFTGGASFALSDNGAAAGPVITLDRLSTSPAAADVMGQISFRGNDSAANLDTYAAITATIDDPTSTSEDATLDFFVMRAGSLTKLLTLSSSAVVGVAASGRLSGSTFSTTGASAGWQSNAGQTDSSNTGTSSFPQYRHFNANGQVGSIATNASATAFNTSSDERLKKNPRAFDAREILDALDVWLFDWKTGGTGYGVLAQQAYKVFPDAVTVGEGEPGDGNFSPWSVDYSKFVPLLMADNKALRTLVDDLVARVAALEALA